MDIEVRVQEELEVLRERYPDLEFRPEGRWARIPSYPLPDGWNAEVIQVAFQIVAPPAAPYGIYVPRGLLFNGQRPNNYGDAANAPFPGEWSVLSWAPEDGAWQPATTTRSGANYLNWALGFAVRFAQGI
ncbi:MAG: hypothetical protein ACRD2L_20840 [Terriglobia bacterium]